MRHITHLLRKQVYEDKKGLLIYSGVLFGLLLIPNMIQAYMTRGYLMPYDSGYLEYFGNFLLLGGFIMTSLAFANNMHCKVKQHAWLMLPVHAHEKLITSIIYYAVIYPIALILFFTASSAVIEGLNSLFFSSHGLLFNPFDADVWEMVLHYIILQSVFLLGSVYFRNRHFVKTVLSLMGLGFVMSLIAMIVFRIAYAPYFDQLFHSAYYIDENILWNQAAGTPLVRFTEVLGKILYYGILAPFCWVVAYFRIREVEATDAV